MILRTASLRSSARASPSATPVVSNSLSFWLVRSDAGILDSTGMPPLAAGANRRRLVVIQARVHPRLVFQQGYAFTGQEGFVVEIYPETAAAWVANFKPGSSSFSVAYPHPNGRDLV